MRQQCPSCKTEVEVPENALGKNAQCCECQAVFRVAADSARARGGIPPFWWFIGAAFAFFDYSAFLAHWGRAESSVQQAALACRMGAELVLILLVCLAADAAYRRFRRD